MSKNIVICLDGTWNDKDDAETKTNVALLHDICVNDGVEQISCYGKGVGTDGWYDKKLGGVHGIGLSENVRQAYTYLARNFEENDIVFIFGFSRGAFTARSLAGLVYQCGLLPKSADLETEVTKLYDSYKDRNERKTSGYKSSNRKCPIKMLGVWDTVGALGVPISFLKDKGDKIFSFHDTKLSPEVELACHAVAIDEKRESFEPTLWQETAENKSRIEQVWFAGVHSDIGGGYKERHHSNMAYKWMIDLAVKQGLKVIGNFDNKFETDFKKNIHESAFNFLGIEFGVEEREAVVTADNKPKVHQSVLKKMKERPDYEPLALIKNLNDRETLAPYEIEE